MGLNYIKMVSKPANSIIIAKCGSLRDIEVKGHFAHETGALYIRAHLDLKWALTSALLCKVDRKVGLAI